MISARHIFNTPEEVAQHLAADVASQIRNVAS